MSLTGTETQASRNGAVLVAAAVAGAVAWSWAAPAGDSVTTLPAVRIEADRLVTPDGWLRRPGVEKPPPARQASVIPIHGVIVSCKDNEVLLKVDESSNVKLRLSRSAVARFAAEAEEGDGKK